MSDHSGSEVIRIGQSHPALGPWKLESNRVSPIGLRFHYGLNCVQGQQVEHPRTLRLWECRAF